MVRQDRTLFLAPHFLAPSGTDSNLAVHRLLPYRRGQLASPYRSVRCLFWSPHSALHIGLLCLPFTSTKVRAIRRRLASRNLIYRNIVGGLFVHATDIAHTGSLIAHIWLHHGQQQSTSIQRRYAVPFRSPPDGASQGITGLPGRTVALLDRVRLAKLDAATSLALCLAVAFTAQSLIYGLNWSH